MRNLTRYAVPITEMSAADLHQFVHQFDTQGDCCIEDDAAIGDDQAPIEVRVHEGRLQWMATYAGPASEDAYAAFLQQEKPEWRDVAPTAVLCWPGVDEDETFIPRKGGTR